MMTTFAEKNWIRCQNLYFIFVFSFSSESCWVGGNCLRLRLCINKFSRGLLPRHFWWLLISFSLGLYVAFVFFPVVCAWFLFARSLSASVTNTVSTYLPAGRLVIASSRTTFDKKKQILLVREKRFMASREDLLKIYRSWRQSNIITIIFCLKQRIGQDNI